MDWEAFYNHFREPDFIPGYEIEHRLGGGAFGEVYKAHKHSIEKSFAIKFLKVEDGAKERVIERELEQVRHFASIDHPNLVTIEDMGAVMGVPYLVMGYAGEMTLARRIAQGSFGLRDALSYFVQTCRGVLALHDRRLVHFDLKPGNVFIHGDVARVGDYGLSKLMTEGRMTLSFGRGTPHYMAPEMLKGRADHRADIYSLGVILFECVSGEVPFDLKSNAGVVLRETDAPPKFADDFPAELRVVIERCLRLDPADRFDSVEDLLVELGQTARRGDSIRVEPGFPESAAGRIAAEVNRARRGVGQTTSPSDELRTTAAELTRGAVEVARGVWDGLRTAKQPSSTVEEDGSAPERSPEPVPATAPSSTPVDPSEPAGTPQPVGAAPQGTIPVPPRSQGGSVVAGAAGLSLSFEVFFSLVRGVFRRLGSFLTRRHRSMRERSGSRFALAARFTLFYLFLIIAGQVLLSAAVEILK
jgi:eukaryotic-like serine/threonine-protein kinase